MLVMKRKETIDTESTENDTEVTEGCQVIGFMTSLAPSVVSGSKV